MKNSLQNLYAEYGLDKELTQSLNYVIWAITFGMICFTIINGPALTGYARALGAGDFIYGILMAMPVVGSVFQIYASYLLERTRVRKKMFITFGIIQRLLWVPVALVPYIFPMDSGMLRIWTVIVLVTLTSVTGAFVNVSFYSWIGELIPLDIRGRYFSVRSRISTIAGLLTGLVTAWLLDILPGFQRYAVVFIIAGIFGTCDILCFIKVKDIPMEKSDKNVSMIAAVKECFSNLHFRKFILFWTVWGFGINLSAPFFNMYAIGPLKMSFTMITLTGQIVCNLTTIFFITRWGRILDKYGSKPVLYISCTITSIITLLWLFASPENYIPILIFNLIGGMVWCGTDITNQKMLISNIPEENRSMGVAVYFVVTSIFGNALAYVSGGFFLEQIEKLTSIINMNGVHFNQYQLLFILTTIIRLAAVLIFLPGVWDEHSASLRNVYNDACVNIKNKLNGMM